MPTIVGFVDSSRGRGLPEGGKAGQFLKKKTDSDFDCEWGDAGSTSSDNPVEIEVNKSDSLKINGLLTAYRIGYMIVIEALDVSIIKPSNPNFAIEIGHINKIPGFNFLPCTTVFASFDMANGEYTGYGIIYGDVDLEAGDGHYVILVPNVRRISYSHIYFSMIIPLYDDLQEGPTIVY